MIKRVVTLLVVLSLLTVPLAGTVGAASGTQTNSDQEFETNLDNLSVWERSALSLRTDLDNAATTVSNSQVFLETEDGAQRNIERDTLGVFNDGDDVTLELREISDVDVSEYEDKEITVILGEVNPQSDFTASDLPSLDTLTTFDQDTLDELNENVTFTSEATTLDLDDDRFTKTYNEQSAGHYFVLVAVNDDNNNGLSTDNGDLVEPNSQSTIIGVENFQVQDSPSDVTHPATIEPGDDVTFDVTTELDGNQEIGHVIALYDEETLETELFIQKANSEINSDFTLDDLTLKHSIESINGVANLEEDIDTIGLSLTSDRITGPQTLQEIIKFTTGEFDQERPQLQADGTAVLDGSVTAQIEADTAEITVETLDSWDDGEYRFLHIASADSTSQFATNTGTITIEEVADDDDDTTTGGGGSGGSGGAGGAPPADDGVDDDGVDDEAADGEDVPPETPNIEDVRADLDQIEPNTQSSTPIVDNTPDQPGVTVNPEETESVREITFSNDDASGNVDIREWQNPPESVSQSVSGAVAAHTEADADANGETSASVLTVADISPDSDAVRDSSATIQLTVDTNQLDNPENTVIVHERDDTWETLETTVSEPENGEITLAAETESFSLFAIAQVESEEEPADEEPIEDSDDGLGTTGLIIGLLVVLALIGVAAVAYRRTNSGGDNSGL